MIPSIKEIGQGLAQLCFPNHCRCCQFPLSEYSQYLCFKCKEELPFTEFERLQNNPVEKVFWGRSTIENAAACLFFNTGSLTQQIIHHIKYHNEPDFAVALGKIMGNKMKQSGRFLSIDAIIPLPLYRTRERQRGYNQAERLAKGIADVFIKPVWTDLIIRTKSTATQTKKNRVERWENVDSMFSIPSQKKLNDLHLLLVDDVITTGATIEACASVLQEAGAKVSISTLAFAMK